MNIFESPIFSGISEEVLIEMKAAHCFRSTKYQKGETIFHTGDFTHEIGIVSSGMLHIENIDLLGNKTILSSIEKGEIFAETYALCHEAMMVDVVCIENAEIFFLDLSKVFEKSVANQSWYSIMSQNLLILCAKKNLILSNRIFCTSSKTARKRILTYLSTESIKKNSMSFSIPFNRQQMANYLNLDRTVLSKELSKMQREGILNFKKNSFELIKKEELL